MKCSNSAAKWRRGKPLNILLPFFYLVVLSFFLWLVRPLQSENLAVPVELVPVQSLGNPKLMACQSQSSSSRSRSRTANTALSRVSGLSTPPCWPLPELLPLLLLQNAASFRLQLQALTQLQGSATSCLCVNFRFLSKVFAASCQARVCAPAPPHLVLPFVVFLYF